MLSGLQNAFTYTILFSSAVSLWSWAGRNDDVCFAFKPQRGLVIEMACLASFQGVGGSRNPGTQGSDAGLGAFLETLEQGLRSCALEEG